MLIRKFKIVYWLFIIFNKNFQIDRTDTFINLREISKRILLPEGRFCIIPCTFKQGNEGNFLLRVFVEKHWGSSEGGRIHSVNDAMDSGHSKLEGGSSGHSKPEGGSITDGFSNIDINVSPGKTKPSGFL